MKYIKQLDTLRAVAALMVIFNHWTPQYYFISRIPFAAMGVTIFFVLSGFLITWILLENKNKVDKGDFSNSSVLKSFYVRRTLRIFPIYYFTIFFLYFAHKFVDSNIPFNFPYFITYTSNFYFYKIQSFNALGAHLWSLAVEEQFYLFWPILILFTKKKYLLHLISSFILAGIISEVLLRNEQFGFLITTSCFYVFGVGALLAWFVVYRAENLTNLCKTLQVLMIIPIVYYIFFVFQIDTGIRLNHNRPVDSIVAFYLVTFLVHSFIKNQRLALSSIWNNKYLISLGKISYGIYLYHPFVSIGVYKFFTFFGVDLVKIFPHHLGDLVFILFCFVVLLFVAWLSWILIERPLLSLKRYFNYVDKKESLEYKGQIVS